MYPSSPWAFVVDVDEEGGWIDEDDDDEEWEEWGTWSMDRSKGDRSTEKGVREEEEGTKARGGGTKAEEEVEVEGEGEGESAGPAVVLDRGRGTMAGGVSLDGPDEGGGVRISGFAVSTTLPFLLGSTGGGWWD